MQIVPVHQVVRAEEEGRTHAPPAGRMRQRAARQRIVVLALFPDAGIVDKVNGPRRHRVPADAGHHFLTRGLRPDFARVGDHRRARHLLPVQQQRITGHGDDIAQFVPMVHGDHAVVLDPGRTGPGSLLGPRVDRIGQVAPVHQVVADRMPPVRPRVRRRIRLEEEMPLPLPETQPVGVVQPTFGADKVIERPVGIGGLLPP